MDSHSLRNWRKLFEIICFYGLNVIAEADSAVSSRPQKPQQNFYIIFPSRKIIVSTRPFLKSFSGFNGTTEAACAAFIRLLKQLPLSQ
jgi:hypothetical protein